MSVFWKQQVGSRFIEFHLIDGFGVDAVDTIDSMDTMDDDGRNVLLIPHQWLSCALKVNQRMGAGQAVGLEAPRGASGEIIILMRDQPASWSTIGFLKHD